MNDHAPRLLDQVRHVLRRTHDALRTADASVGWIRRYVLFHHKQHPRDLGAADVEAFLTDLAVQHHVAASTQNQAFSALLFLYNEVLHQPLDRPINAVRAQQPAHLPTVLTRDEAHAVLNALTGMHQIMAKLLYGSGLRLMECVRLRVKDVDIERRALLVRDTKGNEDRVTVLPHALVEPITEHLRVVRRLHEADLSRGYGAVYLPDALDRTYPTSSHPITCRSTRAPPSFAVTTLMQAACKKLSAPLPRPLASPSVSVRTPSVGSSDCRPRLALFVGGLGAEPPKSSAALMCPSCTQQPIVQHSRQRACQPMRALRLDPTTNQARGGIEMHSLPLPTGCQGQIGRDTGFPQAGGAHQQHRLGLLDIAALRQSQNAGAVQARDGLPGAGTVVVRRYAAGG